jgi:large subunit ribosomal protein LP0
MANHNDSRKAKFAEKLNYYLNEYNKVLTVGLNNVGSKALAETRQKLRERGIFMLKGKNTLTRKVLQMRAEKLTEQGRTHLAEETLKLLSMVGGNVGFVFMPVNVAPEELCGELTRDKVIRPAKAGMVAPCDVYVNPGPTRCSPETTSMFQTLGFTTKIQSGQVQILSRLRVVTAGEKVTQSAAEVLAMLGIKPFHYGLTGQHIYDDGTVLPAKTFDEVRAGVMDAYRNVLAVGLALEGYSWPGLELVRERLKHAPAVPLRAAAPEDPLADDESDDSSSSVGGPTMWDEDTDSESDSESDSEESSS